MKKLYLFLTVLSFNLSGFSQSLNIGELITYLDMPVKLIDTALQGKGYRLIKKEIDSSSGIYNYSHLDRNEGNELTLIRSVNFMDVQVKNIRSRLLTYRTYSEEDYKKMLAYLLNTGFRSTHKFDFKDSKHTLYEKDGRTVRLKLIDEKLPNGKILKVYEVEVGR